MSVAESAASKPAADARKPFLSDVKTLRERARHKMMDGAVTASYELDPGHAVDVLNQALATEIVCVLRYKRHAFMARGPNSEPISAEFATHAGEEQAHADLICERIVQLGGAPDLNPEGLLSRSHSQYVEGQSLREMVEENLIAERIAIDSYRDMAHWFGAKDSTTRRMLEGILAQEEEHADDMADLLERHQGV